MSVTSFDTLTYAKLLQEAGFTAQQAEAQAEALRAVVDQNLATKQDLKEMETRLDHKIELVRRDMKEMDTGLRRDMKEMESRTEVRLKELDAKIELSRRDTREMETRLMLKMELMRRETIIWLGGMIVVATATLGVLMKVL
ncbi:MAG: hypothetical protein IID61_17585 [SAR324 cluster bacterium]|nr:hypothetical protein [SAR324 cluster bacterium]